jgi:hypothetical protein
VTPRGGTTKNNATNLNCASKLVKGNKIRAYSHVQQKGLYTRFQCRVLLKQQCALFNKSAVFRQLFDVEISEPRDNSA